MADYKNLQELYNSNGYIHLKKIEKTTYNYIELENFERYNGSKTVSGKREAEFATLKQKILTESIGHDTFVRKIEQGNKFFEYQTEQKKLLEGTFFNAFETVNA